ncbi:MAG: hypothetical protein ABI831_18380 [Betaproteobacteria bacterium]
MAKRGQDRPAENRKSEVVTIRLDPKLKYLAELAARKQHRSLSSYIEWAVQESLNDLELHASWVTPTNVKRLTNLTVARDGQEEGTAEERGPLTMAAAARIFRLWDPDEPDRVVRLGAFLPDLLTHDEQIICKLVGENDHVWKAGFQKCTPDQRWAALIDGKAIDWDRLRDSWALFRDVAQGTRPPSDLPGRKKSPPLQR